MSVTVYSVFVIRARIARDQPICDQLIAENTALTSTMFLTKDAQQKAIGDVEQCKSNRTELIKRKVGSYASFDRIALDTIILTSDKQALNGEIQAVEDAITRTRARIVQSPERIKKTISVMSTTVMEDKKTVALHESKARDLQTKINALHNIEKVSVKYHLSYTCLI